MKKIILMQLFVALCVIGISAQLQVKENGNVHIGYSSDHPGNIAPNILLGYAAPNDPGNGNWGFEDLGIGLNLWKPWPSAFANNRNYYLFISQLGDVGIGKVPSYKLDVNGDIATYGTLQIASDERLKSNIQAISNRSNRIYQLEAVSYIKSLPVVDTEEIDRMKGIPSDEKGLNTETERVEFGFIAQKLMEVYPELVSQDKDGYYGINYIGLIPLIIEALKEQRDEIEALINSGVSSTAKNTASPTDETLALDTDIWGNKPAELHQNVPNPFSQATQIRYYLPETVTTAYLCFYDLQGKQLRQITLTQRGAGSEIISGSQFAAGMYLYALIADGQEVDVKRMILTE